VIEEVSEISDFFSFTKRENPGSLNKRRTDNIPYFDSKNLVKKSD